MPPAVQRVNSSGTPAVAVPRICAGGQSGMPGSSKGMTPVTRWSVAFGSQPCSATATIAATTRLDSPHARHHLPAPQSARVRCSSTGIPGRRCGDHVRHGLVPPRPSARSSPAGFAWSSATRTGRSPWTSKSPEAFRGTADSPSRTSLRERGRPRAMWRTSPPSWAVPCSRPDAWLSSPKDTKAHHETGGTIVLRSRAVRGREGQDIDFSDIPELEDDYWKRAESVEADRTVQDGPGDASATPGGRMPVAGTPCAPVPGGGDGVLGRDWRRHGFANRCGPGRRHPRRRMIGRRSGAASGGVWANRFPGVDGSARACSGRPPIGKACSRGRSVLALVDTVVTDFGGRKMKYLDDYSDQRYKGACPQCGAGVGGKSRTSDHIPSRCLLRKPYPSELPTMPTCRDCNSSLAKDEEYLCLFLQCV